MAFTARDHADGVELVKAPKEQPVQFVVGLNPVLPGLERTVQGREVGESWSEVFEPEEAFGIVEPTSILKVKRHAGDEEMAKVGMMVKLTNGTMGRVLEVQPEHVVIDANHPLAGRRIAFDITLVDVEKVDRARLSGVQKETMQEGDGKTFPKGGSRVTVHYTGRFADSNKEFDSSRRRKEPFTFVLGAGQVIAGWDVGIAKLSLGERALLHIPSELAYGSRGFGGIPPNSDLIFDVELLKVEGP